MFKYISVIFVAFMLSGCDFLKYEVTSNKIKEYEVLLIKPPKNFYLDLKDIETGVIHKNVYISKYCNGWDNIRVGDKLYFEEEYYKRFNNTGMYIRPLKNFCK